MAPALEMGGRCGVILGAAPALEQLRIRFYDIFKKLKQSDPITLRVGPNEVSSASMTRLVRNHRKWVAKILVLLLDLAGYQARLPKRTCHETCHETSAWMSTCDLPDVICEWLYFTWDDGQ